MAAFFLTENICKRYSKMRIKFISLASGSSGNCYYLGTGGYGILIDAGIGARMIKKKLKECGISLNTIRAVFVTHDHTDHIKALGYLGEGLHIPVYATAETHGGINRSYCMSQKLYSSARHLIKEETIRLEDFHITPFEVPHDGTDNVGYFIEVNGMAFSVLTDLGEITPSAAHYIRKTNYLVIESNYDKEMLRTGRYPFHLKERIVGGRGHLSNTETASFLAENFSDTLRHIWLCHLSQNNNHPELAYKTVEGKLREKGIIAGKDIQVNVLKRSTISGPYEMQSDSLKFAQPVEVTCAQLVFDM